MIAGRSEAKAIINEISNNIKNGGKLVEAGKSLEFIIENINDCGPANGEQNRELFYRQKP